MIEAGSLLPWLVAALMLWVTFQVGTQVVRQNGRVLLRLEAMEARLDHLSGDGARKPQASAGHPQGLAPGTPAPEFELKDLDGDARTLSQWRGRRLLLLFFDSRCGFCQQLAPELAALPLDGGDGRPLPLLLATGTAEANRSFVLEHGLGCPLLLIDGSEVATTFRAMGTPVGYLIDEEGRIVSELAAGGPDVLALAGATVGDDTDLDTGNGAASPEATDRPQPRFRPVSESRIDRSGLRAGSEAPGFVLPRLGGGEVSLGEYRGRPLLLVFSDPACGPCDQLAGRLGELYHQTSGVEVLMVSRRDEEANAKKVAAYDLTFPVVLQRSWEISRRYARFATPIAYLIDAAGRIAAEVAEGPDAILELYSQAVVAASATPERRPIPWPGEAVGGTARAG